MSDARTELLNFLRQQHQGEVNRQVAAHAQTANMDLFAADGGSAEIQQLVQYTQQLEATEEKRASRSKWVFGITGFFLLAMAIGAFGSAILPWVDSDATNTFMGFGFMGLIFGGAYALARVQSNPLEALHARMKKLHARLVKPERRQQPKGMFKSRRDKIIAGVAGGLASRLGVKPGILRLLFLMSIFFTSGATVLLYLVLAVGLSFLPADEEKL